eukprot:473169-Rhodomonas_salina.4
MLSHVRYGHSACCPTCGADTAHAAQAVLSLSVVPHTPHRPHRVTSPISLRPPYAIPGTDIAEYPN